MVQYRQQNKSTHRKEVNHESSNNNHNNQHRNNNGKRKSQDKDSRGDTFRDNRLLNYDGRYFKRLGSLSHRQCDDAQIQGRHPLLFRRILQTPVIAVRPASGDAVLHNDKLHGPA